MKTVEINLYLMAEQYIIVISQKHHLLDCIQDNKIGYPSVIVNYFPNRDEKQILDLLLAPNLFL